MRFMTDYFALAQAFNVPADILHPEHSGLRYDPCMQTALLALLTLLSLLSFPRPAQTANAPDARAITFVNLFHDTCMVYLGQDQALDATLERNGFKILPAAASADFLQGADGLAWAAPKSLGEFVVAVLDEGICEVFAHQARAADVRQAFDGLARASASPVLPVVRQSDRVLDTSTGPVDLSTYLQGKPGSGSALQLTLSTSASAAAHSQAIATLSLVDRPSADQSLPATRP